jgi:hypothetical protein
MIVDLTSGICRYIFLDAEFTAFHESCVAAQVEAVFLG